MTDKCKNEHMFYVHCKKCLEEKPKDVSPFEFRDIEVLQDKDTVYVRCARHDKLIISFPYKSKQLLSCGCC